MTFEDFKEDLLAFLAESNVNLGRKTTKTRQVFFGIVEKKCDAFQDSQTEDDKEEAAEHKPTTNPMDDRIVCIKPKDSRRGLDVGKGVHAMTPSESQRADEELGRSPYAKGDNSDE